MLTVNKVLEVRRWGNNLGKTQYDWFKNTFADSKTVSNLFLFTIVYIRRDRKDSNAV